MAFVDSIVACRREAIAMFIDYTIMMLLMMLCYLNHSSFQSTLKYRSYPVFCVGGITPYVCLNFACYVVFPNAMAKITPEIDSQFPRQQIDKIVDMESTMAAFDATLKHSV